ncbi:MAG: hypothetical protein Q4D38_04010 [Planctomycetia bacterium]|nr:hypothetical protein [Planctomycetia bacterium]
MHNDLSDDDIFFLLFSVTDKLHQNALITSTNKKNIALLESLTYRQQKALVSVMILTEHIPSGISLKKLAERLNMTVPATSVLVESMVQNKMFLRIASQTDRRAVCIKLSDFGEKILDTLRQRMRVHIAELMSDVTQEDRDAFARVVRQFHEKLFPREK